MCASVGRRAALPALALPSSSQPAPAGSPGGGEPHRDGVRRQPGRVRNRAVLPLGTVVPRSAQYSVTCLLAGLATWFAAPAVGRPVVWLPFRWSVLWRPPSHPAVKSLPQVLPAAHTLPARQSSAGDDSGARPPLHQTSLAAAGVPATGIFADGNLVTPSRLGYRISITVTGNRPPFAAQRENSAHHQRRRGWCPPTAPHVRWSHNHGSSFSRPACRSPRRAVVSGKWITRIVVARMGFVLVLVGPSAGGSWALHHAGGGV
jgi:hypothetical protein